MSRISAGLREKGYKFHREVSAIQVHGTNLSAAYFVPIQQDPQTRSIKKVQGVQMTHCPFCGTPFPKPPTDTPE